jgi:acyl carrier protein
VAARDGVEGRRDLDGSSLPGTVVMEYQPLSTVASARGWLDRRAGMQRAEIRSGVRTFILQNVLGGEPAETLTDSTRLLTTGIVSSLAVLELVGFLEDAYDVALRRSDLGPDRLDTIDLIVTLVEELQQLQRPDRTSTTKAVGQ